MNDTEFKDSESSSSKSKIGCLPFLFLATLVVLIYEIHMLRTATPPADSKLCEHSSDCGSGSICDEESKACVQICAKDQDCEKGSICNLEKYVCNNSYDLKNGLCSRKYQCILYGECTLEHGECRVANDADCQHSRLCKELGECSLVRDMCMAKTDLDCSQSKVCLEKGKCYAVNYRCSDHHANAQCTNCKKLGLCTLQGEKCIASTSDCASSLLCKNEGKCTVDKGICVVGPEDCKNTKLCLNHNRCSEKDGRCVASDQDCKDSLSCKRSGLCTSLEGRCVAGSATHCTQSDECRLRNHHCHYSEKTNSCSSITE